MTDLDRASWLVAPQFAVEVADRSKRDGSPCGWLNLVLDCDSQNDPVLVRVQTIAVNVMKQRLLGRLPYERELTLYGKDATVVFRPGNQSCLELAEDAVTIRLREAHLVELVESLQPHAGFYPVPGLKNVVLEVLKTEIKDQDDKVVEVVE